MFFHILILVFPIFSFAQDVQDQESKYNFCTDKPTSIYTIEDLIYLYQFQDGDKWLNKNISWKIHQALLVESINNLIEKEDLGLDSLANQKQLFWFLNQCSVEYKTFDGVSFWGVDEKGKIIVKSRESLNSSRERVISYEGNIIFLFFGGTPVYISPFGEKLLYTSRKAWKEKEKGRKNYSSYYD